MSTDHPALQAYFAQLEAAPTPALTSEETTQLDGFNAQYKIFAAEHGKYSEANVRATTRTLRLAIDQATTPDEIDTATKALAEHEATNVMRFQTYSLRLRAITDLATRLLVPAYEREKQRLVDHRDALKAINEDLKPLGLTAAATIAQVAAQILKMEQNVWSIRQVMAGHSLSSGSRRSPAHMARDLGYQEPSE